MYNCPRNPAIGYVQVFGRRRQGALHARGRPASKKRQGAKSRSAGRRLGVERYGDFRLGAFGGGEMQGRRDLDARIRQRAREEKKRPERD